jgi:hypothetical protein
LPPLLYYIYTICHVFIYAFVFHIMFYVVFKIIRDGAMSSS